METVQTEKKQNKSMTFFENNYAMFFAPIIVLTIYIIKLVNYGVFPFGDDYTVASYDLSAQMCPFIEHLFDALKGRST